VTLRDSFVTRNRSAVNAPSGRYAEGGGIGDDGTLTIEDSSVSGNSCDAATAVPNTFPFEMQAAVGGGIRITDRPGANASISGTAISRNQVSSTNLGGDAQANSGGLDVDGSLLLVDSRVDRNTVRTSVPPASGNLASAAFAGIEVTGAATIRNTSISGNLATAVSATGPAIGGGVGIANLSGQVTLARALVIGNRGIYEGGVGLPLCRLPARSPPRRWTEVVLVAALHAGDVSHLSAGTHRPLDRTRAPTVGGEPAATPARHRV
jgi:hypothetical protein